MTEDLSFPTGKFQRPSSLSPSEWDSAVRKLATQPTRLRAAVLGMNEQQLDTPYRPGGWTVRQLVHHVADSHLNMYIRLKLGLTEDNPTITPYDQDAWSKLADVNEVPIATSLQLLDSVHERALSVLRHVAEKDRERQFMHPENGPTRIDQLVALYSWHGDHHIAHVSNLKMRMGW